MARGFLIAALVAGTGGLIGHSVGDDQLVGAGIGFCVIALLVAGFQWAKTKEIGAPPFS